MIRIIHLSDPHFGAADTHIAETFLKCAEEMKPELTILSGDLTMRVRRRELIMAKNFIDRLPKPRLVIPGNHDIPSINQVLDRFFNPFGRYKATFGNELEPELTIAGVHVVSMNSSRAFGFHSDWSEGRLTNEQLMRMKRQFSNGPINHIRILVLHHPLLELQIDGRAVVKPLKKLMLAIEAAGADLVMCGHFHRSQILLAGATEQWRAIISQAPTVCSTRLHGEPQGFHEISIHDGFIELKHHIFKEGDFHPAAISVFQKGARGWEEALAQSAQLAN